LSLHSLAVVCDMQVLAIFPKAALVPTRAFLKSYGSGSLWKLVIEFPTPEDVSELTAHAENLNITDTLPLIKTHNVVSVPLAGTRDYSGRPNELILTLPTGLMRPFANVDLLYLVAGGNYLQNGDQFIEMNMDVLPLSVQVVRKL
jgi:hypothetical protein